MKRCFDILASLLALVFFSPLLLIIGLCIKLTSPGPIIFWSDRIGRNNKIFAMPKFRSMSINTPSIATDLMKDPKQWITPLGALLRKTSLDELPQLWSILRGDMSVVGPRPHAIEHNEQYRKRISGYMQRHAFKPGITGLAQIMDLRGETKSIKEMKKRVELDLIYQREWNLILDLKIILKTILKFKSTNSY